MSTFNVTFNIDNDAFHDAPGTEIARILRELAAKVEGVSPKQIFRIKDANGARVGFATALEITTEVPA